MLGADPPPRKPTTEELLWGKRLAAVAVILGVAGVAVGGSASAVFLVAAMGFVFLFAYCNRHTTRGSDGGNFS